MELGRVTYELSTNMATVTERRVSRATGGAAAFVGGGGDDEFESENVLDGWRGDILSQLMDLWGMVLGTKPRKASLLLYYFFLSYHIKFYFVLLHFICIDLISSCVQLSVIFDKL